VNEIIEKQRLEITNLYSNYTLSLNEYSENRKNFSDAHKNAEKFFGFLEQSAAQNNSSESIRDSAWNQWLAETCMDVLPIIKKHYDVYRIEKDDINLSPSSTAFASMQRMVSNYDSKKAKEIRQLYFECNLPTYGFDNKGKKVMTKSSEKKISITFGIVSIVVLLVISLFIPNPSAYQYTIFRIILAISTACCAAGLTGFIEVTISNWVKAGGAFAVFVIVYCVVPAALK